MPADEGDACARAVRVGELAVGEHLATDAQRQLSLVGLPQLDAGVGQPGRRRRRSSRGAGARSTPARAARRGTRRLRAVPRRGRSRPSGRRAASAKPSCASNQIVTERSSPNPPPAGLRVSAPSPSSCCAPIVPVTRRSEISPPPASDAARPSGSRASSYASGELIRQAPPSPSGAAICGGGAAVTCSPCRSSVPTPAIATPWSAARASAKPIVSRSVTATGYGTARPLHFIDGHRR